VLWPVDELGQQPIVKPVQLFTKVRRGLQEEPTQALRIRITGQSGQILKGAVGAQQGGGFEPVQAQHDRIDQGQNHLGQTVVVIAPGIAQTAMQPVPQLQHSKKFVEEEHAAIVRQALVIKGDSEVSR
jgi:hypothetical protein